MVSFNFDFFQSVERGSAFCVGLFVFQAFPLHPQRNESRDDQNNPKKDDDRYEGDRHHQKAPKIFASASFFILVWKEIYHDRFADLKARPKAVAYDTDWDAVIGGIYSSKEVMFTHGFDSVTGSFKSYERYSASPFRFDSPPQR